MRATEFGLFIQISIFYFITLFRGIVVLEELREFFAVQFFKKSFSRKNVTYKTSCFEILHNQIYSKTCRLRNKKHHCNFD